MDLRGKTDVNELTDDQLRLLKSDYKKYGDYTSIKRKVVVVIAALLAVCLSVLIVVWFTVARDSFENERNLILVVAIAGVIILACVAVCIVYAVQRKKRKAFCIEFRSKYSNALIHSYVWNCVYTDEQRRRAAGIALASLGGRASPSVSESASGSYSGYTADQPKKVYLHYGQYYVNPYNEIVKTSTGSRTPFKVVGNDIYLVTDSRMIAIGWMHPGGAVNYANDYSGERPFTQWEEK